MWTTGIITLDSGEVLCSPRMDISTFKDAPWRGVKWTMGPSGSQATLSNIIIDGKKVVAILYFSPQLFKLTRLDILMDDGRTWENALPWDEELLELNRLVSNHLNGAISGEFQWGTIKAVFDSKAGFGLIIVTYF